MTEDSHSSQYLLMNKDVCILHFSCTHNEFEEVLFAEEEWLVQYCPIGYHGLQSFLEQRRAPKHRAYIRELLEQCGCGDMEGFLRVTHALSLNDTFWVKGTESPLQRRRWTVFFEKINVFLLLDQVLPTHTVTPSPSSLAVSVPSGVSIRHCVAVPFRGGQCGSGYPPLRYLQVNAFAECDGCVHAAKAECL